MEKMHLLPTILAVILAVGLVAVIFAKPEVVSVGPGAELIKTLDVSADGTASADPNLADIFITVETKAETAEAAQSANADKVNSLKMALVGTGFVKEVTTTSFNVYPDFIYSDYMYAPDAGGSTAGGYRVVHDLKISTEKVNTVGKILDVATASGASSINYVQFSTDDKTVENLKQSALKAAAEMAQEKAKILASASGVSLGKPVRVSENSFYQPPFYYSDAMVGSIEKSAVPTQVTPAAIEVTATVSISYEIV